MATPGPWTFGVYDATDNFRSIKQHSCVCDPVTMALIATTGPADDPQSQKDAELMAAAPAMADAIEAALNILEGAKTLDDALCAVPFLRDAAADGNGGPA